MIRAATIGETDGFLDERSNRYVSRSECEGAGGLTEPTAYQSICTILPFSCLARKSYCNLDPMGPDMQRSSLSTARSHVEAKIREGLVATLEQPLDDA